jgi:tetratricopeptide (TPR) repeat protein
VTEGNNNAVSKGRVIALLACLLGQGCTHRPAVDAYLDAVMLRELGQEKLAVEKLKAVIQVDRDFAPAYSELGKAYVALGDDERAVNAFLAATRLDPWSLEAHLNLARSLRELDRLEGAAGAYARAAELEPDCVEALMGAAECYMLAGRHVRALTYCELAEQTDADPKAVLALLARVHEGRDDYERAVQAYRRLLALDESNLEVLLSLGVAHAKAGQYDQARDVLVSVSRARPQDGRPYRHLGFCALKRGRADEAIEMYRRAIDLNIEDWEAHRGLGVAYMMKTRQSGDERLKTSALRHWRRSLELNPSQPNHQTLERLIRRHTERANSLQGLDY